MEEFSEELTAGSTGEFEILLSAETGTPARTIRHQLVNVETITRNRARRLNIRGASDGIAAVMSGEPPATVNMAIEEIQALPLRAGHEPLIGLDLDYFTDAGRMLDWIISSHCEAYWHDREGRGCVGKVAFLRRGDRFILEVGVQDGLSRRIIQFGHAADFAAGYVESREIRGCEFWRALARILCRRPKRRAIEEELRIPAIAGSRT
jgi:hypothetical protein